MNFNNHNYIRIHHRVHLMMLSIVVFTVKILLEYRYYTISKETWLIGLDFQSFRHRNNSGESYEYIKKWGSFGESNGQFIFPKDITLDSNNDVYVTDFWNNIIQKFDSNGILLEIIRRRKRNLIYISQLCSLQ